MEIPKIPPADFARLRTNTPAGQDGGAPPAAAVPDADRALIRGLDLPAALQILLTEVRDALALPPQSYSLPNAVLAGREVVHAFLQAVPMDLPDARWIASVERLQPALTAAMDRAAVAITAWRAVPAPIVDAVRESRDLVIAALVNAESVVPIAGAQAGSATSVRPEWAGLAPALSRFWRRRRRVRRMLENPGMAPLSGRDDADDPLDLLL